MTETRIGTGAGAFGPDPDRDDQLGDFLRDTAGAVPYASVDWQGLAHRIANGVSAQVAAPWWAYAARWERRAIPLALAAGLAASFALWNNTAAAPAAAVASASASAMSTAIASGTPSEDAAITFAHSITNSVDPMLGVPE